MQRALVEEAPFPRPPVFDVVFERTQFGVPDCRVRCPYIDYQTDAGRLGGTVSYSSTNSVSGVTRIYRDESHI